MLRLEDYDEDPHAYMTRVLEFLGADSVREGTESEDLIPSLIAGEIANQHVYDPISNFPHYDKINSSAFTVITISLVVIITSHYYLILLLCLIMSLIIIIGISADREPMWAETEELLRDFYAPYNSLLAKLLNHQGFLWSSSIKQVVAQISTAL